MHDARLHVVGAEIDEGADRPGDADGLGDRQLVEPVLQRYDVAVGGQMGPDLLGRGSRVLRLHAQQHLLERSLQLGRRHGQGLDAEFDDRAGDGEAATIDGRHMIGGAIDEENLMAGTREMGAHRAADGAGAPDCELRRCRHHQPPSIIVRVSSTAAFQTRSISSSDRS